MVRMIDPETNNTLKIFITSTDAGRFLGRNSKNHIGRVCDGKWKTCYGYKWEWVKDDEVIEKPKILVPVRKVKK